MKISTHALGFFGIFLLFFCLFLGGCLGAPVAIRTIEGKELQLSQEINWLTGTRLTVSGKDVKTYVQGQSSYAPSGSHVEGSAKDRPGVGPKAPETAGAPSSSAPVEAVSASRVSAISPEVSGVGDLSSPTASGTVPAHGQNLVGKRHRKRPSETPLPPPPSSPP